jgi:choline-sulfatase
MMMTDVPIARVGHQLLQCLALGLVFAGPTAAADPGDAPSSSRVSPATRPNLLVLCSDQQHWQAMGLVDPFFDTPAQDALARESVVFDRSFCTTPQCSPSRSSMLTGFYPHHTGVMGNVGAVGGEALTIPTVGAALQAEGYTTGYFGKWHLGNDSTGNAGWDEENKKGPDTRVTELGIDFIRRHAREAKPFAMFLMYLDPHDIYDFKPGAEDVSNRNIRLSRSWSEETFANKPAVHKQFMTDNQGQLIWGQQQSVWEAYHDFYRQKVKLYDDHVAAVIQAVKEQGLWDDTVIVNTSDHGDMDTNHKLIFKGPFMYEHMVRVPTTIRVPEATGGIGHKRIADYDWVNVDLTPTLLDLAGAEVPESHGQSAKAVLTGDDGVRARPFVIGQYYSKQTWANPIRMIRTEKFKLNVYIDHGDELYDLENDPHELSNLADDSAHAKIKRRLKAELDRWIVEHDDPFYTLKTTPLEPSEWKRIGKGRASQRGGGITKSPKPAK